MTVKNGRFYLWTDRGGFAIMGLDFGFVQENVFWAIGVFCEMGDFPERT